MAGEKDEPNLELPSFRLRHRRGPKRDDDAAEPQPPVAESDPVVTPQPSAPEPIEAPAPRSEPVAAAAPEPAPAPQPEPVARRESLAAVGGAAAPSRAEEDPRDVSPEPAEPPAPERRDAVRPTLPSLPAVAPVPAALAVGVVVGLLGAGLTWLAGRGCDAVLGTPSCGGGPGLLFWVAILLVLAWVGRTLLAAVRAPEPGGTSALAVGLLAVLSLLFLLDRLDSWGGVVAAPLVAAACFALAQVVATATVDTD